MKIYEMLLANAMGESGGGGGGGGGDFATAEVTFNAAEGFFSGSAEDEFYNSYMVALMEDNGRYIREKSLSSSTFNLLLLENSAPCIFVYSEPVITGSEYTNIQGADSSIISKLKVDEDSDSWSIYRPLSSMSAAT